MNIIIIGNSSIRKKGQGKKIDNFDRVIRLNRFQTENFEVDIGSKITDWIIHEAFFEKIKKSKEDFSKKQKKYKDLKNLIIVQFNKQNKESKLATKTINQLCKDLSFNRFEKVSTGLITICYFLNEYKTIHLFNFDFGETNHYFGFDKWNIYRKDKQKVIYPNNNHVWDLEKQFVKKLEQQGRINFL